MSGDILFAVAVAVLATWFILTCLSALPSRRRLVVRSEFLSRIIPTWSFFAPNPGTFDFRLLCRDHLVDDSVTAWREIRVYSDFRPATAAIWNPGQRRKKALFDVAQELSAGASAWDSNPGLIKLSVPYLLLLTYVSSSPRSALSTGRQFALVTASRRDEPPTVVFVSGMHDLERDPGETSRSQHGRSGWDVPSTRAEMITPGQL